jgi:hypothetical protein
MPPLILNLKTDLSAVDQIVVKRVGDRMEGYTRKALSREMELFIL